MRLISDARNIEYIIARQAFLTVVVPPYNSRRVLSLMRSSFYNGRACSISGASMALLTAYVGSLSALRVTMAYFITRLTNLRF